MIISHAALCQIIRSPLAFLLFPAHTVSGGKKSLSACGANLRCGHNTAFFPALPFAGAGVALCQLRSL